MLILLASSRPALKLSTNLGDQELWKKLFGVFRGLAVLKVGDEVKHNVCILPFTSWKSILIL